MTYILVWLLMGWIVWKLLVWGEITKEKRDVTVRAFLTIGIPTILLGGISLFVYSIFALIEFMETDLVKSILDKPIAKAKD